MRKNREKREIFIPKGVFNLMKQSIQEAQSREETPIKKIKTKKSIHQILSQLQSQGVNATLCKKRSKLVLGS